MQPHRDTRVITGRVPLLDPSAYSTDPQAEERSYPAASRCSGILIDATRKGPYPPVGFAEARIYGTGAEDLETGRAATLDAQNPWYGYALGLWNAEDDEMAEAIAKESRSKANGHRRDKI